jgi:hypothetical protein
VPRGSNVSTTRRPPIASVRRLGATFRALPQLPERDQEGWDRLALGVQHLHDIGGDPLALISKARESPRVGFGIEAAEGVERADVEVGCLSAVR